TAHQQMACQHAADSSRFLRGALRVALGQLSWFESHGPGSFHLRSVCLGPSVCFGYLFKCDITRHLSCVVLCGERGPPRGARRWLVPCRQEHAGEGSAETRLGSSLDFGPIRNRLPEGLGRPRSLSSLQRNIVWHEPDSRGGLLVVCRSSIRQQTAL